MFQLFPKLLLDADAVSQRDVRAIFESTMGPILVRSTEDHKDQ